MMIAEHDAQTGEATAANFLGASRKGPYREQRVHSVALFSVFGVLGPML